MTIKQLFNRIIHPIDYCYYKRLLKKIENNGVPILYAKEMLALMIKYGAIQ